jgi:tungstate transport system substrate-binding protein
MPVALAVFTRMNLSSLIAPAPTAEYGAGQYSFRLATGSPGELGLLKALGEVFAVIADARLVWIKAGTGQSLGLLRSAQVDMAMVHAPVAVARAVTAGWATDRTLIGSNEFFIVGPAHDPAGIAKATDVIDAYRRIANSGSRFVSRGDNSGTHQKEMQLWSEAAVEPRGEWYHASGDFMTASLRLANSEQAYFMTDSSTWWVERDVSPSLKVLFRGDRRLVNIYHAIAAPTGASAGSETAKKFIRFVASSFGQKIIRDFGEVQYAESLYQDAAYAKQFE